MLPSSFCRVAAAPLVLLVAILAVLALTSGGVALAGGHHDHDGDPGVPRTENDITIEYKSGDQFSDLKGGFSDAVFKIPNLMYFLP